MMKYKNKIIIGNSIDVLKKLPANLIDCVITSPPYWGLRSYQTNPVTWDGDPKCPHEWGKQLHVSSRHGAGETNPGFRARYKENAGGKSAGQFCKKCGAWLGELGTEPNPDLYIKHLTEGFNEMKRVLKDTGSMWVNIADTYSGSGVAGGDYNKHGIREGETDVPRKSLVGIPERFMLSMIKNGWVLRSIVIWQKSNSMPESALDRFGRSWEYFYYFTKLPNGYYFDTQYEESRTQKKARIMRNFWEIDYDEFDVRSLFEDTPSEVLADMIKQPLEFVKAVKTILEYIPPGQSNNAVFKVAARGLGVNHYAIYPTELLKVPIRSTTKKGDLVFDPFMGSGTTGVVAIMEKRYFLGTEINADYAKIATDRLAMTMRRTSARL